MGIETLQTKSMLACRLIIPHVRDAAVHHVTRQAADLSAKSAENMSRIVTMCLVPGNNRSTHTAEYYSDITAHPAFILLDYQISKQ
jgi:hypothetical protein